jgi:small subunit ribosomal protein S18
MSAIVSPFRGRQHAFRKRSSPLGTSKVVDYLDAKFLQQFVNDQGRILPRRVTGLTAYQQRQVARAIKYARHLALLPFVAQDLK